MNRILRKPSVFLLTANAFVVDLSQAQARPIVTVNQQFASVNTSVTFPPLPSRAGVQAELDLSYSQIPDDTGQGFGLGWSIHVPSISIQSETHLKSHDFMDNIHESFDARFRLALDGEDLAFVGFDREKVLTEYTLEKHSEKIRVIRHFYPFEAQYRSEDGSLLTQSIGSGFEVVHADGLRQYFSGDLHVAEGVEVPSSNPHDASPIFSSFIARWPLVLEVRPGGEAIRYEYVKDQGRSFLSRVSFAGGQSSYQMGWILREAGPESRAFGFPQESRLLYTGMAACFQEKALHTWRFDYGTELPQDLPDPACDQANVGFALAPASDSLVEEALAGLRNLASRVRSWANRTLTAVTGEKTWPTATVPRLHALHRFGQQTGASALAEPRLTFHYTIPSTLEAQPVLHEASALAGGAGFGLGGDSDLFDVNRDGLLDLVRFERGSSSVYFNEGKGYDSTIFTSPETFRISRIADGMENTISPALNEGVGQTLFLRGDIDGDGWIDLMEIKGDDTPLAYLRSPDPQQSFLATESGIQEILEDGERPLKISHGTVKSGRSLLIDISGDGKDDLLRVRQGGQGKLEWSVLLNESIRGTGFVQFKPQVYAFPFASTNAAIMEGAELRFLDTNRDGFVDLVRPAIVDGEYGVCVYHNLGRAGFPNQGDSPLFDGDPAISSCRPDQFRLLLGLEKPDSERMMQMWVIDVNGDGLDDFAELKGDGRTLDYWLADVGQSSFQKRRSLPLYSDADPGSRLSVDTKNKFNTMVLDVDQDGREEILISQPNPRNINLRQVMVLDFNRRSGGQTLPAGLLFAVESEDGGLDQFVYVSHMQELLREKSQNPQSTRGLNTFPYHDILLKQWIHSSSQGLLTGIDDRQTTTFDYSRLIWDTSMGRSLGYSEVVMRKPGSHFRGTSSPAQHTVLRYGWRPEDLEAQRYLSDVLESRSVYETAWTASAEAALGKYLDSLSLDPLAQFYRQDFGPQGTGEARLLTQELKDFRTQIFRGPMGEFSNFRNHAFIYLDNLEDISCGDDDSACQAPRREKIAYLYDDKERLIKETIMHTAVEGPDGRSLKERNISTEYGYDSQSEDLGILDNVQSLISRRQDETVIESEDKLYHPVLGRIVQRTTRQSLQKSGSMLPQKLRTKLAEHQLQKTEKIEYDVFGNVVKLSDTLGLQASTAYDATGVFALKETDALGHSVYFCRSREYCLSEEFALPSGVDLPSAIGVRDFVLDENGAWSLAEFDSLGRLSHLQRSSGYHEIRTYEAYSRVAPNLQLVTRGNGPAPQDIERELIYTDSDDREIARVQAVNESRAELVSARILNRGGQAVYDAATSQINGTWEDMQDHRRVRDWLLSLKGGDVNVFDSLGRSRLLVEADDKRSLKTDYLAWGWRETVQGRDMETEAMSFLGRSENTVEAVWDESGTLQEFERDEQGLISRVRLADEVEPREYGYDSSGRVVFVQIPGLLARVWTYDARGRVSRMYTGDTAGKKPLVALSYAYDPLDRLLKLSDVSSPAAQTLQSFTYDRLREADGNVHETKGYLVQAKSLNPKLALDESISLYRDSEGRIRESRHDYRKSDGSLQSTFAESYGYRFDEKLNERRSANGIVLSYGYDMLGELSRVEATTPWGSARKELLFELGSYDDIGQLTQGRFAQGAFSLVHQYDPSDKNLIRSSICRQGWSQNPDAPCQSETLRDVSLRYDGQDQVKERSDGDGLGLDLGVRFDYTARSEVKTAAYAQQELSWEYTPGGNLRKSSLESAAALNAQAASPLLPRAAAGRAAGFDELGRLIAWSAVKNIEWNSLNQIVALDAAEKIQFGYGPFGDRSAKVQKKADAMRTTYFPFPGLTAGTTEKTTSIALPMGVWAHFDHTTQTLNYGIDDENEMSALKLSANGERENERRLDPFGRILEQMEGSFFAATTSEIHGSGLRRDAETGWIDAGDRFYLPELGAFSSFDESTLADPESCAGNAWASCQLYRL